MREVRLDLTHFEEKVSLHRYLKETLDFPFYYGANLDALHDELTSETEELSLVVVLPHRGKGKMEEYLPRLKRVFEDAAEENYHLSVAFEEDESIGRAFGAAILGYGEQKVKRTVVVRAGMVCSAESLLVWLQMSFSVGRSLLLRL